MNKRVFLLPLLLALAMAMALPLHAGTCTGLSGAIFTTLPDGSEVNFNIYSPPLGKPDVYLDGGPPMGAPAGAAGLPGPGSCVFGITISGTYVFQVTDPPGKNLLSTDNAGCRQFSVNPNGVIQNVTAAGACGHMTATNTNTQVGGLTVQLCALPNPPLAGCFLDTPNKGGEYKVWVTPIEFFGFGSSSPNCKLGATGTNCNVGKFGFVPHYSKTDNFKTKAPAQDLDTRFHDTNNNNALIDGLAITWIDTLGASNQKVSYYNATVDVNHEAHVEATEVGTHQIVIANQSGCTVDGNPVFLNGVQLPNLGPQTVSVPWKQSYTNTDTSIFIDVYCN